MIENNVLIIEDHPIIVNVYSEELKRIQNRTNFCFNIDSANSCDEALSKVNKTTNIVFLDITLPRSKDERFLSGEDLGIYLREKFKKIKIIVITALSDNSRLNSIFKSIDPDGFLIKSDLTSKILNNAIENVIEGSPYYTKTVLKLLRKISTNDFTIDSLDRKLLFELSKGAKMKELPGVLMLSIAALERRKRILKERFNVEGKGDRQLIREAEIKGFI